MLATPVGYVNIVKRLAQGETAPRCHLPAIRWLGSLLPSTETPPTNQVFLIAKTIRTPVPGEGSACNHDVFKTARGEQAVDGAGNIVGA